MKLPSLNQHLKIPLKNSLKSDYPPPEVALTKNVGFWIKLKI